MFRKQIQLRIIAEPLWSAGMRRTHAEPPLWVTWAEVPQVACDSNMWKCCLWQMCLSAATSGSASHRQHCLFWNMWPCVFHPKADVTGGRNMTKWWTTKLRTCAIQMACLQRRWVYEPFLVMWFTVEAQNFEYCFFFVCVCTISDCPIERGKTYRNLALQHRQIIWCRLIFCRKIKIFN